MSNIIKEMLELKDENIIIFDKIEKKLIKKRKCKIVYGQLTYDMTHCEACGSHHIVKNGTRLSKIKIHKISEHPGYLYLKKQRYVCQSCSKCFTAKTSLVDAYCCLSNSLKLAVLLATQTVKSRQMIADDYCVSPSTVHQVIEQNVDDIKHKHLRRLPDNLSVGEFRSTTNAQGAMSLIVIDNDTHDLVDVLDDRKQDALKKIFYELSFGRETTC